MCVLYNDIGFVKLFYLLFFLCRLLESVLVHKKNNINNNGISLFDNPNRIKFLKLRGGWNPLTSFRQLHFCCACSIPGHGFQ